MQGPYPIPPTPRTYDLTNKKTMAKTKTMANTKTEKMTKTQTKTFREHPE